MATWVHASFVTPATSADVQAVINVQPLELSSSSQHHPHIPTSISSFILHVIATPIQFPAVYLFSFFFPSPFCYISPALSV